MLMKKSLFMPVLSIAKKVLPSNVYKLVHRFAHKNKDPGYDPSFVRGLREYAYGNVSYAQQGEDLILDRILLSICGCDLQEKYHYVDVGAYHPISHSLTYLLYKRGWSGLCVDMSIETGKLFKSYRPKDRFVCSAVGSSDANGIALFPREKDISLTAKIVENTDQVGDKRPVEIRTLSRILKESGVNSDIVLLNIDVEGYELKVLQGLDFLTYKPWIIACEIHTKDISELFKTEIYQFLCNKGYICVGGAIITWFFVREDLDNRN